MLWAIFSGVFGRCFIDGLIKEGRASVNTWLRPWAYDADSIHCPRE